MKPSFALVLPLWLLSACAAQMVERDVNDDCAKQGKKPFIKEFSHTGSPLFVDTARAKYVCLAPERLTHFPARFGADGFCEMNWNGVGIVSVTPGSVADKAGLKNSDVILEFAGTSTNCTRELQAAIDRVTAGDRATIKLRRRGRELNVIAQF